MESIKKRVRRERIERDGISRYLRKQELIDNPLRYENDWDRIHIGPGEFKARGLNGKRFYYAVHAYDSKQICVSVFALAKKGGAPTLIGKSFGTKTSIFGERFERYERYEVYSRAVRVAAVAAGLNVCPVGTGFTRNDIQMHRFC